MNLLRIARRVARRVLRAKAKPPCDPHETGYAWIDPRGKVHRVKTGTFTTHAAWALDWLRNDPQYEILSTDQDYERVRAEEHLLDHGWVKVTNAWGYDIANSASPKAKRIAAEICAECTVKTRQDPFEKKVYVGRTKFYTIDEFVKKFGGRRVSEEMYAAIRKKKSWWGMG